MEHVRLSVENTGRSEKLHSIEVFANGYKLAHIRPNDFQIDSSQFEMRVPLSGSHPAAPKYPVIVTTETTVEANTTRLVTPASRR